MEKIITLVEGNIYFYVGFFDKELSQPCISTLEYAGKDKDPEIGHLFLRLGSEDYLSFTSNKLDSILDKEHLIKWLQANHSHKSVKETYVYKYT